MRPFFVRRWIALAIASIAAAATGSHATGRAQSPDGLVLHWDAPERCPDRAQVLARIRAHLPREHRAGDRWFARATIAVDGARYRLELVLRGPASEARRSIDGFDCAALADAAALLVALALDPDSAAPLAADATPSDPPAEHAARADVAVPPPAPRRERQPTAERTRTQPGQGTPPAIDDDEADDAVPHADAGLVLAWDAGAALRFDFGMLPQTPALGVQAQLGLRIEPVRVALGLTWWPPARSAPERYPTASLDAHGLLGDALVCVELVRAGFALSPCVAGELGELTLATHAIRVPVTSEITHAAAGGGLRAEYRLAGSLEASLQALALAPFERARWLLQTARGDVEVFVAAPMAIRIAAGMAYVFE
jgi:hypothetical protein